MNDQTQALTVETRPRPSMAVGGNVGALIPQDIEQAFRIASALAQSGMTPNGFKTPETCFVAIMAGAELGLPPFQSLQSFAIINNRPTLWGDALMAVVRTNGFKVREWFEGEGEAMTAYCEVTRPDNGDTAEASFSVDDAKTAGLWKKAGPWQSAPKRMLKMRARSFAIRDGAADVLRGFQIREEVEDYGDPLPSDTAARPGTGLLARLETTQTLATEGFGIRNLADEAGEAAPAAEPKPKRRTNKTIAAEALAAIAEAEPEIVEQVIADHADDHFPGDAVADREIPPADAEVEEIATTTPEPIEDAPAAIQGPDHDQTEPATAFDAFNDAIEAATDVEGLTAALRALFTSGECATPDAKRGPRCKVWARVRVLNDDGAKIAPESDPFVLGCYIEAESDVEALQAVLPLARDQEWFAQGGEGMQAGVARAIMERVTTLKGAQ